MDFKGILEFVDTAEGMGRKIEDHDSYLNSVLEIGTYLNAMGDTGKEIILNRMREEDFVKFIMAAKATLLVSMFTEGNGAILMMADRCDELDGFIHTMILNTIGVLAEEEVI